MNKHIEQAIENLRSAALRVERPERYYDGRHDLRFATEKFENTFGTLFREFALNMCPAVCDALKDKLRITGFSVDSIPERISPLAERNGSGVPGTLAGSDARTFAFPGDSFLPPGGYASPTGGAAAEENKSVDGKAELFRSANIGRAEIDEMARAIWSRNRMALRAGEVHKEVLKNGDAYLIVWPDARGRARFYPNRAANMFVAYDEEDAGRVLWAAKSWLAADRRYRLNLFYPDRIERYISKEKSEGLLPEAKSFVEFAERTTPSALGGGHPSFVRRGASEVDAEIHIPQSAIRNPYGIVPVFHFANNADLGTLGRSELEAAIPVQDGLNKAVLDMLVAMEFSAFRQRWAAGIEVATDEEGKAIVPFQSGIDKIWMAENPSARFGDFEASQLDQFLKVKDSFRTDIASVTGTPLHYFMQTTRSLPSGESLRKAETRFIAKVRDRQEAFGQVWADAMAFALRIEGRSGSELITQWEDPSPLSEREMLENILLKRRIGLPVEQALVEAGYGLSDVEGMAVGVDVGSSRLEEGFDLLTKAHARGENGQGEADEE